MNIKYNNDLAILINKVNQNIDNLMIAHYAIAEKKCIMLKKENSYKSIDTLIDYKKDSYLKLIPINTTDKSYDTGNLNTLLSAAKKIVTIDEIAKYGYQEPEIYASSKENQPPLYIEIKIKEKKKKTN